MEGGPGWVGGPGGVGGAGGAWRRGTGRGVWGSWVQGGCRWGPGGCRWALEVEMTEGTRCSEGIWVGPPCSSLW